MYQKEIIYLHLFDGEIRGSCVGYFKMEKKENRYFLEIQVKNLLPDMSGGFPIRLQTETEWREADMLTIKDGNGKWTGTSKEQILRAEIIVSKMKKIKGESKKHTVFSEEKKEEISVDEGAEKTPVKETKEEKMPQPESQPEPVFQIREPADAGKTIMAAERSCAPRSAAREEHAGKHTGKAVHAPLYEDKWEQLLATYEQIHPYGDNRTYVKLQPKDFIILRENYQHLVNNSFLLHGFYNYRYLILGREKDFYLGVPGVFYEREKMVALMFGFEAFECEGGEAEEGKFGYYLRKVEL